MTLPTEEYIEQAHFFRTLRKRLGEDLPAQEILEQIHEKERLNINRNKPLNRACLFFSSRQLVEIDWDMMKD